MFERFTKNARVVVQEAVAHADGAGAPAVEAEHMLLALLDHEGTRASFALASLGVAGERKESVRDAVTEARRRAGLSQAETDALAGLGIDVSEIVARVEEVHGVGAMSGDRGARARGPGAVRSAVLPSRPLRSRCASPSPTATGTSEDEHILLALTVRPGLSTELLADHGVTYESLTRVLYGAEKRRPAERGRARTPGSPWRASSRVPAPGWGEARRGVAAGGPTGLLRAAPRRQPRCRGRRLRLPLAGRQGGPLHVAVPEASPGAPPHEAASDAVAQTLGPRSMAPMCAAAVDRWRRTSLS